MWDGRDTKPGDAALQRAQMTPQKFERERPCFRRRIRVIGGSRVAEEAVVSIGKFDVHKRFLRSAQRSGDGLSVFRLNVLIAPAPKKQ